MRTMLLSFKPYMYVSSPVCAIKGILYLGKRYKLVE